jgi:hypothetical protein
MQPHSLGKNEAPPAWQEGAGLTDWFQIQASRRPKKRPVKSKKKLHWNLINLIMAIYEILIVGAASSRDYAMTAIKRLFFAAGSRSHEKLM